MTDEFQKWKDERNRILRELDVGAAFNGKLGGEIALCALHKARFECTDIEDNLRYDSGAWLFAHGFKRLTGEDIFDGKELPA